jgi:hypothetical protein
MSACYLFAAPMLIVFAMHQPLAVVSTAVVLFSLFRGLGAAGEGPIICDLLPPNFRSTAVGLANTLNCMAGGIGIFAAGLLKQDWGLGGVFAGVSTLVLAAAFLSFLGYRVFMPRDIAALRN